MLSKEKGAMILELSLQSTTFHHSTRKLTLAAPIQDTRIPHPSPRLASKSQPHTIIKPLPLELPRAKSLAFPLRFIGSSERRTPRSRRARPTPETHRISKTRTTAKDRKRHRAITPLPSPATSAGSENRGTKLKGERTTPQP